MAAIFQVMRSISSFMYERIAIWSQQTECIYLKVVKILSLLLPLCGCTSLCALATECVPYCQLSFFCSKDTSRAGTVNYCL